MPVENQRSPRVNKEAVEIKLAPPLTECRVGKDKTPSLPPVRSDANTRSHPKTAAIYFRSVRVRMGEMHGLAFNMFNMFNMRLDRRTALRAMTAIREGDMPSDGGRVRS